MVDNEDRLLVSDSIKENIDLESQVDQESKISILTFLGKGQEPDVVSILREIEAGDGGKLRLKVSMRVEDGLAFFCSYEFKSFSYVALFLEHGGLGKKIDINDRRLVLCKITEINSEQQTCDCELVFGECK